MTSLQEFEGWSLQSVAQGRTVLDSLEDEAEKETNEKATTEHAGLVGQLKATLGELVHDPSSAG